MEWIVSAIGGVVVAFVLVDIFHTLANPGMLGRVTRRTLRATWTLSGRSRLSGPLAMLAVITAWGVLAVLGWALVYWPHVDGGFSPTTSEAGNDFLEALYVSLVTISTLGLGDVYPSAGWLRLVNPLEALFGFALLTVAVSWVLQVFPALGRRRVLALQLTHLRASGTLDALASLQPGYACDVLDRVTTALLEVRVDLNDYPETYYFHESEADASLAGRIDVAVGLADAALSSTTPEVRHAGATLRAALDDLGGVLGSKFLPSQGNRSAVLEAFAADHRRTPRR